MSFLNRSCSVLLGPDGFTSIQIFSVTLHPKTFSLDSVFQCCYCFVTLSVCKLFIFSLQIAYLLCYLLLAPSHSIPVPSLPLYWILSTLHSAFWWQLCSFFSCHLSSYLKVVQDLFDHSLWSKFFFFFFFLCLENTVPGYWAKNSRRGPRMDFRKPMGRLLVIVEVW